MLGAAAAAPALPGLSEAACVRVAGVDAVEQRVMWAAGAAPPVDRPVRLRFVATGRVALYSFWVADFSTADHPS